MAPAPLHTSGVETLAGVGPSLADKLRRIGLHNLQDLLFHLPLRYQDRTRITPIGALQPGVDAVIEGEVRAADVVFGRRRSLMVKLQDRSGLITLRFFHFSNAQKAQLTPGTVLRCYGEPRRGASGLEFYHPEYQRVDEAAKPLERTLTPVYPATEGLTQQRLRGLIGQALQHLGGGQLDELLPSELLPQKLRYGLADAVRYLHQPPPDAQLSALASGNHPAIQRLAFEELLAHHLSLLQLRKRIQATPAPVLEVNSQLQQQFLAQLPFAPTGAQWRVTEEIRADVAQPKPMLRLLQGDVGSGKTLVAALAALAAVSSGQQVALMAPTEILAEQHRVNFDNWLRPLGIRTAFITGKLKGKGREVQLAAIASGEAQVVIGTHALFQESVQFARLGLCIVDEQHRFGVHQRLSLRDKGVQGKLAPHQLIMTATPIPRTLAMSAYADLDVSVIDELPPGRTPVTTVALSQQRRNDVIERVRNACGEGRQAYWVCTLIEESEALEAQAAEATADQLRLMLPELNIGLVHGRLKPRDKQQVMDDFKAGAIHLLVATTVIEVGVDVPNASLMIIENPERLGLAQLHQLRGRVGRGSAESHCVLLYSLPLSNHGKARLRIMRETNDGFVVAEKDLELRGPGEVLGTRQTGDMQLRVADLQRDEHLVADVRAVGQRLQKERAASIAPLCRRWLREGERYADA